MRKENEQMVKTRTVEMQTQLVGYELSLIHISVAKKEVEEHLVEYCTLREYGFNFEN